jgi:hypothetical protein
MNGRGAAVPASVATGRPSSVHFLKPPFSTAAASKPNARSIHQTRVAHIVTLRS